MGEFNALGSETLERPSPCPGRAPWGWPRASSSRSVGASMRAPPSFAARSLTRAPDSSCPGAESLQTLEAEVRRLYGRLAVKGP